MMDLDNIVDGEEGVIPQKQEMLKGLKEKNYSLKGDDSSLAISYSLALDLGYQQQLVNLGMFRLYMDVNQRSIVYKSNGNRTDGDSV